MESRARIVLLFTGGQDSLLAAALLRAQGCELTGLFVQTLTGCGRRQASERAVEIGLPLRTAGATREDADRFAAAWGEMDRLSNPCAVCRVGQLLQAGKLLREIGVDGVATGEVLGQRPGQGRMELLASAAAAGLSERVLRPLSALRLPPTELELSAKVDRGRLGDLTGRGRKGQQQLATQLGITLPAPGEDCPLENAEFACRAGDLVTAAHRTPADFELLRWGRHFRFSAESKVIVGRNGAENQALADWLERAGTAHDGIQATLLRPCGTGPTALICGPSSDQTVRFATGLIARFAHWPAEQPVELELRALGASPSTQSILLDPAAWTAEAIGPSSRPVGGRPRA